MPPKRKAAAATGSRPSKRVASGVNTPVSMGSSDDEYMSDDPDDYEPQNDDYEETVKKFQPSSYRSKNTKPQESDQATRLFKSDNDLSALELKPDHAVRPLWLDPQKGRIVVETFSPSFKQAQNFLINIAEPQSRTTNVHEYTITGHSLFAAVSVGLTTEDIIRQLEVFSKTRLPDSLKEFIFTSTQSYGKIRLVLKHNRYYIESQ
ncbi:DNA repair helicase rad25, partial [Aureobasidium melanogenum]